MAARAGPRRARDRRRPRAAATRGATRACPDQSEHEKVFRLLDAPSIGLRLSGGYALEPEQSTLAIVAHHPQAVYFGMKSGFLPADQPPPDDVIRGSERDPTRGVTPDPTVPDAPRTQREEEPVGAAPAG